MSRFSIILPVRNGGEYVKECLQGMLQQTFRDFNVIVLDNFSKDGTPEWIASLKDDRIQLYTSDKSLTIEQNWARITGVAKNEFMTMIGHDDVLLPSYLQEMDTLIRQHPQASLYQTHFDYIDGAGKFVRSCMPMDEKQFAHEFLACQMARTIESTGTGYMMRSRDFDALGGMPVQYPNLIYSDFELWVKLMLQGYKATSLKTCFKYRLHDSLSRTTNGMGYQEAFSRYLEFLIGVRKENAAAAETMDRYGKQFLLYYCESLAHRLLKTPRSQRNITVDEFIKKCEAFAQQLIPGQTFQPLDQRRIRLAKQLDQSWLGRTFFGLYKTVQK